jgi:4-hydroxy-tetrahydrodipicolinate synthase
VVLGRTFHNNDANLVAVKEASGSLDQASEIAMRCDLTIISGDDSLTLPLASVGGKGVISVVANIVPADVKAMTDLILEGDFASARQWHRKLFPLSKNMLTLATNPIPIKAAMAILDMCSAELRLPMTPLEQGKMPVLEQTLKDYGLLSRV